MIAPRKIDAAQRRFASYYLSQLQELSKIVASGGENISYALQRFDADYPQIERVLAWLVDHRQSDPETASVFSQMLAVGHPIFQKRMPSDQLRRFYEAGLEVAQSLNDPSAVLVHQLAIANAHLALNDTAAALEGFERARALADQSGDKERLAQCLLDLAFVFTEVNRKEEADATIKQALELYRVLNDRQNEGFCLYRLGKQALNKGEWETANAYLLDAYQIAAEYDNQSHLHQVTQALGELRERQGKLAEALEHKTRALEIAQRLGSQSDIVFHMTGLGISYDIKHDFATAQTYYQQGLEIAKQMGLDRLKTALLGNMGYSAYMQGNYSNAAVYLEEARQAMQESGQRSLICVIDASLVPVYIGLGKTAEAKQAVYEGLELAHSLENKQLQVMMIVAAIQFYISEGSKQPQTSNQSKLLHTAIRCAGFVYASPYADQENRGELDTLRPQMVQLMDEKTINDLLAEGAELKLEDAYEQILALKGV